MSNTLVSLISMGALGVVFSIGLAIASKQFHVESDPLIDNIEAVLPGINCGACGFAGCRAFAEGVAAKKAPTNGCPVGGAEVAAKVAEVLGQQATETRRKVAQVLCKGGFSEAPRRANYQGPADCRIVHLTQNGDKGCSYGCLGCGTCVEACRFDAMRMNENGLPEIIEDNCTACNACVEACPRDIIVLVEERQGVHIRCRSLAKGKETRSVCSVGCIACRRCEKECPVDAITVNDNLARIDYDLCINCRKCVAVCPMNTIDEQDGKPIIKKRRAS